MNIEISDKEYDRILNWYDANMYCQLLVIDDKNDWRLPTRYELDYIYHSKNDFKYGEYWSSSEYDDGHDGAAWVKSFSNNVPYLLDKLWVYYVRPVRIIE
jgi:hypothetical protein